MGNKETTEVPRLGKLKAQMRATKRKRLRLGGSENLSSPREKKYVKYSARKGGGYRVPVVGGARQDKKKVRFSPLLSDHRVKNFVQETVNMLKDKPLALQDHRFQENEKSAAVAVDSIGAMEVDPSVPQSTQVRLNDSPGLDSEGSKDSEPAAKAVCIQQPSVEGKKGDNLEFVAVTRGKSVMAQPKTVESISKDMGAKGQGKDKAKSDGGQPKNNKKQGGFDFSRAVNGGKGKMKQSQSAVGNPKGRVDISMGKRFTILEPATDGGDESDASAIDGVYLRDDMCQDTPSTSGNVCAVNTEADIELGRVLPDTIVNPAPHTAPAAVNLSEYKKSCCRLGFVPDHLVVDDESFMEDNLLDAKMAALGLDMIYAIEDVEDEDNGMAAFMAGQF
ncbi:hypothetical protein E3N88_29129 [Mikania micrantha]|uniref:Uncharacterized protein n=1 Tax=Mikania micrantha TaxID=192012 RepID=A0A5N6N1S7_9ASTR|nr:hypothetical protein E3N88_29129 [Mikania micrantha]